MDHANHVESAIVEATAQALSLLDKGHGYVFQPHDDYAGNSKKNPRGETKWNAAPYIGNAIRARLNPNDDYEQNLIKGLACYKQAADIAPGNSDLRHQALAAYSYKYQEYETFKKPLAELTGMALYEASNSKQADEYAAYWGNLLRLEARATPFDTARNLIRRAHKSPDDDIVSRTGAIVFGEIVTTLAATNPSDALSLANEAQKWLDWTFTCKNDWGREKKANSELTRQIALIHQTVELPVAAMPEIATAPADPVAGAKAKLFVMPRRPPEQDLRGLRA